MINFDWISIGFNGDHKFVFNINWDKTGDLLGGMVEKVISLVVLFVAVYLFIRISEAIIDKFVEKQIKSKLSFTLNKKKANTIGAILKSIIRYGAYITAGIIIIGSTFKVSATVLGSIGFVVGIGAQSLVKDLINGFFILFEDQYAVGDHITIGTKSGVVENIGIRSTEIRDFSGDIHIMPNGTINQISNHSRGNMTFAVEIEIAYEEDVDNAINIMQGVCNEFTKSHEDVKENINVLGITALNAHGVTIKVAGKAKPLSQWKLERELRREIKIALDKENIEIPYPKTMILNDNKI